MGRNKTIFVFSLVFLFAIPGVAGANVLIDGLEEENLDRTLQNDSINFQATYLDKNVSYRDALIPEQFQDDVVKWNLKSKTDNGTVSEVQVQYELGKSTGYSSLNGYKFDSKITFEGDGAEFKTKGGAINVSASSHYEHLIMNYTWDGGTSENIYSAEEPVLFPFEYTNTRTTENLQIVGQGLNNEHEPEKEITFVVAYDQEYNFSELRTDKSYTVLNNPENWFNEAQNRVETNNLNSDLIIENSSDKKIKAFNMTLTADSIEEVETVIETGNENYVDGINTYVLGSIGGTTTYNATSGGGLLINEGFEDGDYTNKYLWEEVDGTFDIKEVNTNQPHTGSYALQLGHNSGSSEWARMRYQGTTTDVKDSFKLSMYIDEVSNGNQDRVRTQIYNGGSSITYFTLADNNLCDGTADDGDVSWKVTNQAGTEEYCYSFNPDQQYYTFELKNIDRNAGTSDIYVNGNLEVSDATTGIETNPIDTIYAYSRYDETIAYFDDFYIGNPNNAPVFEEENTEPTDWKINSGIDLGFNASDPDGDSIELWGQMLKNGTIAKDWTQLNTGTSYDYELTDFYTPTETNNYTLKVKANDTNGAYNISETTQEIDNSPPVFDGGIQAYRSFQVGGGSSYCSRNDVNYSTGTTPLTYDIDVENPDKNHTLYVGRIRNSNSMDAVINTNTVGTLTSTTGTGCNSDNWVVDKIELDSSSLSSSNPQEISLQPSGSTDNYVRMVALAETETGETTLYRDGWDYITDVDVYDPEDAGLHTVEVTGEGFDILKYGSYPGKNYRIFEDTVPATGSKTLEFNASDVDGLTNQETKNLEIDYQNPEISNPFDVDLERIINPDQAQETFNVSVNASDPEGYLNSPTCSNNGTQETVTNITTDTDLFKCATSVSSGGNYSLELSVTDTVGHKNSSTADLLVSKVSNSDSVGSPGNSITIGNSSENTESVAPVKFEITHDLTSKGLANDTAVIEEDVETTGVLNVTRSGNETLDTWNSTTRHLNYSFMTGNDPNNTEVSRTEKIDVWASGIKYYWQNDANTADKRYYRLNTNITYNYSLTSDVTFQLPKQYDPLDKHVELYSCSDPSTSDRYSCSGDWIKKKDTGKSTDGDDQHDATTFETSFSDKLFYTTIESGAEEEESSSSTSTASTSPSGTPSQRVGSPSALEDFLGTPLFYAFGVPINVFLLVIMIISVALIAGSDATGKDIRDGVLGK